MAHIIDNFNSLNISDLKRFGLIPHRGEIVSNFLTWTRNGETFIKVFVAVDYPQDGTPSARFVYTFNGQKKDYRIALQFTPSNLDPTGGNGYYYFLCPVTGERCRNLYLVDGQFMSRRAFRPLYLSQALSHRQREIRTPGDCLLYSEIFRRGLDNTHRRRITYKGNPTPYGRKVAKIEAKLEHINALCLANGWNIPN